MPAKKPISRKDARPAEHKLLPALWVKVVDEDKGIVEEIVAVFGNIDHGKDRIFPGSFTKTIQEGLRNILVLDQHNTDSIFRTLGRPIKLEEVGRDGLPPEVRAKFPDATGGLKATTQYLLDTPEGKGAFIRIKEGAITQRSIGYDPLDLDFAVVKAIPTDTGWELGEGPTAQDITVRNLRTIRLMEYSPVLWGMNPATATVSAKDASGAAAEQETPGSEEGRTGTEPPQGAATEESPSSEKEMTASGPVRRMGDVLAGNLQQVFTMITSDWLTSGLISREEQTAIISAFGVSLEAFNSTAPDTVMGRALPNPSPLFMMGRTGSEMMLLKTEPLPNPVTPEPAPEDDKAGRVLSAGNATAIRAAVSTLLDVLSGAGINLGEESADDESPSEEAGCGGGGGGRRRRDEDEKGADQPPAEPIQPPEAAAPATPSGAQPVKEVPRAGPDIPPTPLHSPDVAGHVARRLQQLRTMGG